MKKADFAVLAAIVLAELALLFAFLFPHGGASRASVLVEGQAALSLPLSRDGVYAVRGALGDLQIEISGGRARILHSTCPDQVCVKTGWLSSPGRVSACLPNGVLLVIDGQPDGGPDVVLH